MLILWDKISFQCQFYGIKLVIQRQFYGIMDSFLREVSPIQILPNDLSGGLLHRNDRPITQISLGFANIIGVMASELASNEPCHDGLLLHPQQFISQLQGRTNDIG